MQRKKRDSLVVISAILVSLAIFLIGFSLVSNKSSDIVCDYAAANQFAKLFGDVKCQKESNETQIRIKTVKNIPPDVQTEIVKAEARGCVPKIECDEFSECDYLGEFGNVIKGEIIYKSFRERKCADLNYCIRDFIERESCAEGGLELDVKTDNGSRVITGLSNGKPVVIIKLGKTGEKSLDIIFVQDYTKYQESCYNGVLDGNEEKIDCGRDCKECRKDNAVFIYFIITLLWIFFVVLLFLLFFLLWQKKKTLKNKSKG